MKVFLLYIVIGLATVVGQTTILRLPLFQGIFYDLLIPLVVFLQLNLPMRKAGALVLMVGFVMDLFSGGIFGLYMTVYVWIFLLVKGVKNYFNMQGTVFRSVLIALCVLGQNLIFLLCTAQSWKGSYWLGDQVWSVMGQVILAAVTGPAVLLILETIYNRVETRAAIRDENRGRILQTDE